MRYTQDNRRIAIATPLGKDVLLLHSFSGHEGISQLFQFDLELWSEDDSVNFDDIVGQNVTLGILLADGSSRYWNGFVSRFSQGGRDANFTFYRAQMTPWLWFLTRTADCRIFQNKKAPDIIQQIFADLGFTDFSLRLYGDFVEREYCAQYRETDFNFVSRLMEEEGIYYFFEHENGKHTLVLANDSSAHKPCPKQPKARYELTAGGWQDDDVVLEWRQEQELRPGSYALADYNFETPGTHLGVNVTGKSRYEIYDYPGEYRKRSEGDGLVRIRLQEEETPRVVVQGSSTCRAFTSGYRFDLTDHYRTDQNQSYVLTSLDHSASQGSDYSSGGSLAANDTEFAYQNTFECVPHSTRYRPARVTSQPTVKGSQTAVVVGPAGEEIYTDKYGRVKVQFHWDREGKMNEESSCWIRVSQPWAGKGWGGIWIPRIGQEVIVDFLEGDPDQPIITGRVYNAEHMPPYGLPDEKTKSTMKSYSSKGGGGFNEMRFEDQKGDEQIFLHAEKNLDVRVKNDEYKTVCRDLHLVVENDRLAHIKNDHHLIIDNDEIRQIGRDHHLKVTGKQAIQVGGSHSFQVTGGVAEVFSQGHSEQVSLGYYLKALNVVVEADLGVTLKCGKNSVVVDPAGVTLTGTTVTIDGSMVRIASGPGSPAMSGTAGAAVSPTAPKTAEDADKADPGEMAKIKAEQIQQEKGKYGSTKLTSHRPAPPGAGAAGAATEAPGEAKKKHWIEIKLLDQAGKPVPGEPYEVKLPDGSTIAEGTLDEKGVARVDGIEDPGTCKVSFPKRHKDAWKGK